jgi:hypothetical protein
MNPNRFLPLLLTALVLFAPNARAAFSAIGVGSSANDGTGDTLRAPFVKVNDNFDLSVLNSAGSATNLTIVGGSFSAITNTTLTASKPVFSAADKSLTSTGTVPVDQGGTGLTAWTLNGIPYASATGTLASGTGLTFDGTTLTVDANLTFTGPQTIATSSGALTLAPASGSSLLVNLATTGDFVVNTDDFVVDTSSGNAGIGTTSPGYQLNLAKATGVQSDLGITSGASSFVFGSQDVSSGRSAIAHDNDNGGSGNIISIGFGTITEGVPANPVLSLNQSGNAGIGTTGPGAKLSINGGLHVGGDSDPGDNNLAVDGTSTLTGAVTHTATTIYTSASIQTLAAGSPVVASATKVIVAGSGGPVTTTAAPTIADGTDGQMLYVVGTNDTNTLELQDEGTLASSNLALGSTSRVLGLGDVLVLMYDTTAASWIEVSFTNN